MYTTKHYQDDLYQICSTYFVKMQVLKDVMSNRLTREAFKDFLEDECYKSAADIHAIFTALEAIRAKIAQNGGRLVEDPVTAAKRLMDENKLDEAFQLLAPIVQVERDNEQAAISFGWLMYKYLKLSEHDIHIYVNNLKVLNDVAQYTFKAQHFGENERVIKLKDSILWSIRSVVQRQDDYADIVLQEVLRFIQGDTFIEQGLFYHKDPSASRILLKLLRTKLTEENYFLLMEATGFQWFDGKDYAPSSFVNEHGETIAQRSFAEVTLNIHAKKLLEQAPEKMVVARIQSFIDVLTEYIKDKPQFEWLPYYQAKLLLKVQRNEEARHIFTSFARTKNREFWVWEFLGELVEGEAKFHCLCAAVRCKTKPEMLLGVQDKLIPQLMERGLFAQAKYELEQIVAVRMRNWGKLPVRIAKWQQESWYKDTEGAANRDDLKPYAEQAEVLLYDTLPAQPIFVTYVNKEKGIINFAYMNGLQPKRGYFYMAGHSHTWQVDEVLNVKMQPDKVRDELYRVYAVVPGDDAYKADFIEAGSGYVEKESSNAFAFVDDAYISAKLVQQHKLQEADFVKFIKKRTYNTKRKKWSWAVERIKYVEKDTFSRK